MRAREKAKLQKAIDTLRNPGGGMKLVSHGFEARGPSTGELRRIAEAAQEVLEASHNNDLLLPLRTALRTLEQRLVAAGLREWPAAPQPSAGKDQD